MPGAGAVFEELRLIPSPPPSPLIGSQAFQRQWSEIENDVLAAVGEVGRSGWYILGERLRGFEGGLAAAYGRGFAIGCGNGLDALEIGLRCLDLQPGERVITAPMSAFATALAILRAGGRPLFVDVDESGLLDLAETRRCLEADPGLRFCIPVHLYGHCLDLEELAALRAEFGLLIVEDGAQAMGAGWGEMRAGDAGQLLATSFYPTKNLGALGDGGALLTDSPQLATRARSLRDYGQSGKYVHSELGLNSRLDEMQAAILAKAMLPRQEAWNARRSEIAAAYLAGLDHPQVKPLPAPAKSRSVWHLFPVMVAEGAPRQSLLDHLRASGVLGQIHYPVTMPDQPCLTAAPGSFESFGHLPRARALAAREVSLPITPDLSAAEVARVVEAVNSWRP
jgi:dTDP-4-amino-4,6-dideoxygalactose transaminase